MKTLKSSSLIDLILSLKERDRALILGGLLKEISEHERLSIFKKLLQSLSRSEIKKLHHLVSTNLYSKSRWKRIETWMESIFSTHYDYTPYKVAMMCLNYFRINRKMKPFVIAQARKVKKRVYYRLKRSIEK